MASLPLTIHFGSSGDYRLWSGDGWHHDPSDAQHTWSDSVSKLRLMMEFVRDDVLLEVDVIPLRARGVEQELYVFLNGAFVAYWRVAEPGMKTARIESSFFTAGECLFTFLTPKALSPRASGFGEDERTLGVAFRSVALTRAG